MSTITKSLQQSFSFSIPGHDLAPRLLPPRPGSRGHREDAEEIPRVDMGAGRTGTFPGR